MIEREKLTVGQANIDLFTGYTYALSDRFVVSRKEFLITLGVITSGLALMPLFGCGNQRPREVTSTSPDFSDITPELERLIGASGTLIVSTAADDYLGKYGCVQSTITFSQQTLRADSGEQSDPGVVYFNSLNVARMTNEELRAITLHALTHACQPLELYYLPERYTLLDGKEAYAIGGLSLFVSSEEVEELKFALMEEGAAEALAYNVDRSYFSFIPEYYRIGQLTIWAVEQGFLTYNDLSRYAQSNDLMAFVSTITGREAPSYADLEWVMSWWHLAYRGERELVDIQADILDYRKR
jgi:hypothetical protein